MGCASSGSIGCQMSVKNTQTKMHPCYSKEAHDKFARMHMPVAPHCNISCNYCNRKFDCVNESRPGVTSEILTAKQAKEKFLVVKNKIDNLKVVGIAGPGDALANWSETKKTIEKIKEVDQDVIFCLSTNGLMLPDYAQEIIELGIHHVTVTVNCLHAKIGEKIYKVVNYKGKVLRGIEGAKLLLENQLTGIEYLVKHGVLVKVNIVMINGVNNRHIPEVVKKMKELGVFITNIMPLIPAEGSVFSKMPQTSMKDVNEMRKKCEVFLPQMKHCQQCRADAIGMLNNDRSAEFRIVKMNKTVKEVKREKYKIAVSSKTGQFVDLHFGHTENFYIYQWNNGNFNHIETRMIKKYCQGVENCDDKSEIKNKTIDSLTDCDAVLTMRIGFQAQNKLLQKGVVCVEYCDSIVSGLIYAREYLSDYNKKRVKLGVTS